MGCRTIAGRKLSACMMQEQELGGASFQWRRWEGKTRGWEHDDNGGTAAALLEMDGIERFDWNVSRALPRIDECKRMEAQEGWPCSCNRRRKFDGLAGGQDDSPLQRDDCRRRVVQ